jgi:DNA mismatch endonuclease (patch repair protein)
MQLVATDARNPAPTSLAVRAVMRANRGRDTGPELELRRNLRALGLIGYRLNRRIGHVRPDIAFGPAQVAVFVHGCYWHRCPVCRYPLPRSNVEFWRSKFRANQARDQRSARELRRLGWRVITVWAHEIGARGGRFVAARRVANAVMRTRR